MEHGPPVSGRASVRAPDRTRARQLRPTAPSVAARGLSGLSEKLRWAYIIVVLGHADGDGPAGDTRLL